MPKDRQPLACQEPPSGRIPELDGIRGIAVLMVVAFHYIGSSGYPDIENVILKAIILPVYYFSSGVNLFFVLSGFLIGGIILENYEKLYFIKTFWIRRSGRIFPAAFLLIALNYVFMATLTKGTQSYEWLFGGTHIPLWSYLTFTQNIVMGIKDSFGVNFLAVTWTLAVEEQFYLIAPLAMLFFGRRRWLQALLPLFIAALALSLLCSQFDWPPMFVSINTPFRMNDLIVGIGVAALFKNKDRYVFFLENRAVFLISFLLLLISTGVLMSARTFGVFSTFWWSFLYGSFLAVALLYRGSLLTALLRLRILCFFGAISYGLYLYHQPVSGVVHGWLRGGAHPFVFDEAGSLTTGVAFLLATFIAWLSFTFYEKPFLRYAHRFTYEKGNVAKKETY